MKIMKNLIVRCITALSLAFCTTLLPIITKVESFYHPATQQTLLLAHDTHLDRKEGTTTQEQQQTLITRIKDLNGSIAVEEKTAPPKNPADLGVTADSGVWKHFVQHEQFIHSNPKNFIGEVPNMFVKITASGQPVDPKELTDIAWEPAYQHAPMHCLTERANKAGISRVDNVECRFFENNNAMTAGMLNQSNDALIGMINGWNHDPIILREEYEAAIRDYSNNVLSKHILAYSVQKPDISINDLIKQHDAPENAHALLGGYNARLLDALLLHNIYHTRYEPVKFVLCGSDHYTYIKDAFTELGYDEGKTYGQDDWSSKDQTQWIIPALDMNAMFDDLAQTNRERKICKAIEPALPSALNLAPFPLNTMLSLV